jgi:hypothetical protein
MLWSTFIGGGLLEAASGIALDAAGNVYVAGSTESTNFPTTPGAYQAALSGMPSTDDGLFFNYDAVLLELAADGSQLLMSTLLGGGEIDGGGAVFLDPSGDVYLGGGFRSSDFPESSGFTISAGYANAGFVARFSADGSTLKSMFQLGETGESYVTQVFGNGQDLFIGGTTDRPSLATPGAFQSTLGGAHDAFVARLTPDARRIAAFTYLGGTEFDSLLGAGIDRTGRVQVMLTTMSAGLPVLFNGVAHAGDRDFYWAALQPNATAVDFGTYFGSAADDVPWGAAFAWK